MFCRTLHFKLNQILFNQRKIMIDLTKIQADIAAQTTVLQGAVIAFGALAQSNADQAKQIADLKAAIAAEDDAATQAALDALDQSVQANTAIVSNAIPAITANTPTPSADAQAAAAAGGAATPVASGT